jgi:hypothetical protein
LSPVAVAQAQSIVQPAEVRALVVAVLLYTLKKWWTSPVRAQFNTSSVRVVVAGLLVLQTTAAAVPGQPSAQTDFISQQTLAAEVQAVVVVLVAVVVAQAQLRALTSILRAQPVKTVVLVQTRQLLLRAWAGLLLCRASATVAWAVR